MNGAFKNGNQENEEVKVLRHLTKDLDALQSQMRGVNLRRGLLECISLGLIDDIETDFIPCTLRGHFNFKCVDYDFGRDSVYKKLLERKIISSKAYELEGEESMRNR